MAVQTLERGIMARRQNAPAPKPVMASEARAQLESSVIAATLSGMNRDAHLLGDVLDICPASCFVTAGSCAACRGSRFAPTVRPTPQPHRVGNADAIPLGERS